MLKVANLNIYFPGPSANIQVVNNVSFNLNKQKLAIVGQSGSGKSLTAKALLGLVPSPGIVRAQTISVLGNNVLTATNAELQSMRGHNIAMIGQDPKYSLNPVIKVGKQVAESFIIHHKLSKVQAKSAVIELLKDCLIDDPKKVYDLYPHQLSGGMGQRVMIAMMIACGPQILIADEATASLDADVRDEILELFNKMYQQYDMSIIMISHDLPLVASFCDHVMVMYKGSVVESCPATKLSSAQHPYTQGLWNCIPSKDKRNKPLPEINYEEEWC